MDPDVDRAYWLGRLTEIYGTRRAAAFILDAYNDAGECAPRLIRRFGITEGNRQTLSLGMTLDQLVNPDRYERFPTCGYRSRRRANACRSMSTESGITSRTTAKPRRRLSTKCSSILGKAVASIDAAEAEVTKNRAEFERLRNDIHCIRAMSEHYAAKVNAALLVLRYQHSRDIADMERAANFLAESVEHYRALARLTEHTYDFANSMQTSHRRIPVPGAVDGKPANFHWTQLLSVYQDELAEFQAKVELLE